LKRPALILILLAAAQILNAQVYVRYYKITSDGTNLGNLTAQKTVAGDTVAYRLTADVIVNMLAKIHVENRIDATYVTGNLHSSSASMMLNQNPVLRTMVERSKTGFDLENNGHPSKLVDTAPFSALRLYFEMPPERTKVFSELDGKIRNMRKLEEKKFELIDPENPKRKVTYTYSSEEGLYSIEVEIPHLPKVTISQVREPVVLDAEKDAKAEE